VTFNLQQAERQSVQDLPKVDPKTGAAEASFWSVWAQRGSILPRWGTRERERVLRQYDRDEYNTLWQGATSGLIKKIKATPYELKGGRNLTTRFDRVLRDAQFGAGWGVFLSLMLRDYLRFDGGAYAEIIAPGNPLRPPTGAVTGIAHLDSYRCLPTGDPQFPVVYYDRRGKLHALHHTRVLHLIDMPDGDQDHPGYGLCSLSRAIAVVQRQLFSNRYVAQKLDDKPEAGIVIANNMNKEDRDKAYQIFRGEQSTDAPPDWGKVAWFFNMNPSIKATLENFSFSAPPEKFDLAVYVNIDVNELALAIGVDKQELWELSGATGTAGQSIIQAEKSEGKAPGEIRATLEREINNKLLPESLEFEWKVRDGRAAQQEAATAEVWVSVAQSVASMFGSERAAELLANQVPAAADVLFDESGQIRLSDVDRKPAAEQSLEVTVDDSAPNAPASDADPVQLQLVKDFDVTRAAFTANLGDLLNGAMADEISRRRAGVVMRALLNTSGKAARNDGLVEGGVTTGLSENDLNAHAVWLAEQSQYVTNFLSDAYKNGLSDAQISQHVELWANKSLQGAFYEGVLSADKDGDYEFYGDDGKESCATCRRLQGKVMRMSEWTEKQLRPGLDTENYDCGGWQCRHGLRRVTN
jgi:hypothetical protein